MLAIIHSARSWIAAANPSDLINLSVGGRCVTQTEKANY